MYKRVPEKRNSLKKHAPEIAEHQRQIYSKMKDDGLINDTYTEKINEILDKLSKDPLAKIWPETIPRIKEISPMIASMTWRFLTFDEKPVFLTGDNPVFYFPDLGIAKPKSELSFPISSHVTLWATRRSDLKDGYFPTDMRTVKDMNRRIAKITTRYVFHAKKEEWILNFLAKRDRKLK
jgi:hypothetical protein